MDVYKTITKNPVLLIGIFLIGMLLLGFGPKSLVFSDTLGGSGSYPAGDKMEYYPTVMSNDGSALPAMFDWTNYNCLFPSYTTSKTLISEIFYGNMKYSESFQTTCGDIAAMIRNRQTYPLRLYNTANKKTLTVLSGSNQVIQNVYAPNGILIYKFTQSINGNAPQCTDRTWKVCANNPDPSCYIICGQTYNCPGGQKADTGAMKCDATSVCTAGQSVCLATSGSAASYHVCSQLGTWGATSYCASGACSNGNCVATPPPSNGSGGSGGSGGTGGSTCGPVTMPSDQYANLLNQLFNQPCLGGGVCLNAQQMNDRFISQYTNVENFCKSNLGSAYYQLVPVNGCNVCQEKPFVKINVTNPPPPPPSNETIDSGSGGSDGSGTGGTGTGGNPPSSCTKSIFDCPLGVTTSCECKTLPLGGGTKSSDMSIQDMILYALGIIIIGLILFAGYKSFTKKGKK